MMPDDFPQYAELWQEQIDPQELAELQAMAKKIERTARWKRLLDFSLSFGFLGLACLILWLYPASPLIKFGYALLVAVCLWVAWRRHEITKASRATAIGDPRVFFEKTIKNVRAELDLSTMTFYLSVPGFILAVLLASAVRHIDSFDMFIHNVLNKGLVKTIVFVVIMVVAVVYFVRDNIKLRQQLRRLESMSREWDESRARDLREGP